MHALFAAINLNYINIKSFVSRTLGGGGGGGFLASIHADIKDITIELYQDHVIMDHHE